MTNVTIATNVTATTGLEGQRPKPALIDSTAGLTDLALAVRFPLLHGFLHLLSFRPAVLLQ